MNTTSPTQENVNLDWHLVDAQNKVMGKVASDIARILIGKNKALFSTHYNVGDKVVVINASKLDITRKKMQNKIYTRYTGYPGGVREESLEKLMQRNPSEALRRAVSGMLPKNKLRKVRLSNLYIYPDANHPHSAQIKS